MSNARRMECEVTFLREADGGRKDDNPAILSGNTYRPHIVVGDPKQRQAKIVGRMVPVEYADGSKGERWTDRYIDEEYLGVLFERGPDNARAGQPLTVTLMLPFWSDTPEYKKFQPGAEFTLREGPHVVGYGRAQRWVHGDTAQATHRKEHI